MQILEQFVSEGVGGIVLAPIDDTALKRPVAAAKQKGIPVVIIDSALKGEPVKDFVSTDRPTTTAAEKWLASSWESF
jgi:ribose transport system substrate-binding protein